MKAVNYNDVLRLMEKYDLLTSAWTGIEFVDMPELVQHNIGLFTAEIELLFKHENETMNDA